VFGSSLNGSRVLTGRKRVVSGTYFAGPTCYYGDISSKDAFFKGFGNLGGQSARIGSLEGHPEKVW
jgi:hypothetical protein